MFDDAPECVCTSLMRIFDDHAALPALPPLETLMPYFDSPLFDDKPALPSCCADTLRQTCKAWIRQHRTAVQQTGRYLIPLGDGRVVDCGKPPRYQWPLPILNEDGIEVQRVVCVVRQQIEIPDDNLAAVLAPLDTWERVGYDLWFWFYEFIGEDTEAWTIAEWLTPPSIEPSDLPDRNTDAWSAMIDEATEAALHSLRDYGLPATFGTARYTVSLVLGVIGIEVPIPMPTRGLTVSSLVVLSAEEDIITADIIVRPNLTAQWAGSAVLDALSKTITRQQAWAQEWLPELLPNTSARQFGRPANRDPLNADILRHFEGKLAEEEIYDRERNRQRSLEKNTSAASDRLKSDAEIRKKVTKRLKYWRLRKK